jgi:opacity protein-like surface antigen
MKKILFLLVIILTSANAVEFSPYVSGKVGFGSVNSTDSVYHYAAGGADNHGTDEDDSLVSFKLAGGLATDSFRTELEIGFSGENEFSVKAKANPKYGTDVKTNVKTYFVNAYYDYKINDELIPYVGFGLGVANIKNKYSAGVEEYFYYDGTEDTNAFAFNISVGANYKVAKNVFIDVGYRYTNLGEVNQVIDYAEGEYVSSKFDHYKESFVKAEGKLTAHELTIGAKYLF